MASELAAERLDARRVAQIQAVNLEPIGPLGEVRLLRVAGWPNRGESAS